MDNTIHQYHLRRLVPAPSKDAGMSCRLFNSVHQDFHPECQVPAPTKGALYTNFTPLSQT
eukprot:1151160-Pelagomonas_calceolata.AAC.1